MKQCTSLSFKKNVTCDICHFECEKMFVNLSNFHKWLAFLTCGLQCPDVAITWCTSGHPDWPTISWLILSIQQLGVSSAAMHAWSRRAQSSLRMFYLIYDPLRAWPKESGLQIQAAKRGLSTGGRSRYEMWWKVSATWSWGCRLPLHLSQSCTPWFRHLVRK